MTFRVNDTIKLFFGEVQKKMHFSLYLNLKHMNETQINFFPMQRP